MSKVVLRKFDPDMDSGFIYSTFPKGVYHGSYDDITLPKKEWFALFYEAMKASLDLSQITIACMDGSPEVIIGYSIVRESILQFVYVKESYRKQGIARILTRNRYSKVNTDNLTIVGHAILRDHPEYREGNFNE